MSASSPEIVNCPKCGARIATTASGDFGCLACWLQAGLDHPTGERDASASTTAVPGSLGNYSISRRDDGSLLELGRGAMGITFRGEDVSLRRPVALKVINAELCQRGSRARDRFVREARVAASLHHPHIATVYQFGIDEESGQCFCAMELVEGETLDERVRRSGPLEVPAVLEIARQIVDALIVAEKHGVVHRDLKPGNVMIEADAESAEINVKIIDFGLAKALGVTADPRALTNESFLGTPAFASPEQLSRVPVDVRSDIYSLGATLWYLLTGQMPFGDRAPAHPPLAQLKAAHVPRAFVALLLSMLATEPAARPTARQIAARLAVMKRPPRRRAVLFGGALVTAALLVAFYLFAIHRAPRQEPIVPSKSVAVLPFESLSEGSENSNFADGVQDALLTDLARIAELKVVSRTSVMQYKRGQPRNLREIGRQLGVAHIVEGAVTQAAGKIRITGQLIDARTDLHEWAETYDRPVGDIFAIQSEIAQKIAVQLDAKIAPPEKAALVSPATTDLEAFASYTRARKLLDSVTSSPRGKENLLQATQLLAEAVARDPNFMLAYCELAKAHDSLYFLGFDRTPWRLALAESAVTTALQLQPAAGEPHLARARHLYQGYLAYEPALAELELARQKLPNNPAVFTLAGYIYRRQGKMDESAREFENALSLDPRNVFTLQQVSLSYNTMRRYADTQIVLDHGLAIAPQNIELLLLRAQNDLNWHADTRPLHRIVAAILAKNPAAASDVAGAWLFVSFSERNGAEIERAIAALGDGSFGPDAMQFRQDFWRGLAARMNGDTSKASLAFTAARAEQARKVEAAPDFAPALCILGLIDAGLGRKADAIREGRRALEMLPVTRDPVNGAHLVEYLAMIYAWSGEPSLACEQLEAATKIPGTLSYGQLRLSPMWDPLRKHPRFAQIVATLAPADEPKQP